MAALAPAGVIAFRSREMMIARFVDCLAPALTLLQLSSTRGFDIDAQRGERNQRDQNRRGRRAVAQSSTMIDVVEEGANESRGHL